MSNEGAIGFIDSGVGGLTVVKEALRQLPHEEILYVGDTARCPYGPRPREQVLAYTWEMTNFLLAKGIKMLVIACNTATAAALDDIRGKLSIPVVGVILPGSRAALKYTENHRIGIIGTVGTIKSGAYQQALKAKVPHVKVIGLACPKFVPLVESNESGSAIAKMVVSESLRPLKYTGIDTLILGCTHYPLLRPVIQNVLGDGVRLVDSGAETVSEVSMLLDYFQIAAPVSANEPRKMYYTTGSPAIFRSIGESWLHQQIQVEKISF